VICHGPWTLVEAGVVQGRTLTSYPSVRTDIRNAGGYVVDQEVVTDQNITSSRWPDDCRRSVPGSWSSLPRARRRRAGRRLKLNRGTNHVRSVKIFMPNGRGFHGCSRLACPGWRRPDS
jgi:DJ-1/PfpI family